MRRAERANGGGTPTAANPTCPSATLGAAPVGVPNVFIDRFRILPSTWKRYGVDADDDGRKDPYNPVDAIFAAARYLKAAGADKDVKQAIFADNHAAWSVDNALMRALLIGGLPADLVGSLTGLTPQRRVGAYSVFQTMPA